MLDHLTSGSFSKPRADFYWLQLQWLYSTDVLEDSQWAQYLFEVVSKGLITHVTSSKYAENILWKCECIRMRLQKGLDSIVSLT